MHCKRYEKQIALIISDDLPARKVRALQQHLSTCDGCRAFESSLREGLRTARSLANVSVPADSFTNICHNVMSEVSAAAASRRIGIRASHGWITAAAIVALVLVCLIAVRLGGPRPVSVKIAAPPTAPEVLNKTFEPEVIAAQSSAPRVQSAFVKLYSDDPNVVFYLVSDNNGG